MRPTPTGLSTPSPALQPGLLAGGLRPSSSSAATPAPAIDQVLLSSTPETGAQAGRNLVDELKKRSTLVGLVQPAGIVVGLASHPIANAEALGQVASLAVHGQIGAAAGALNRFASHAVRPTGIGGVINGSTLGLQTVANAGIGSVELYQGLRNKDHALVYMGGADLLAGAASATQMAGAGLPAMGLALAAAATKVTLVTVHHGDYSRIQKAKVLFDAAGSISSAALRSGLAPLPGLVGNLVFGPGQMLYMNNAKVRAKVDHVIDWTLEHIHHHPHEATPAAAATTQVSSPEAATR